MDEKRSIAQKEKETFEAAYRHNPKDAELVLNLGLVTAFLGDRAGAIDLMKQAAKLRPFNDTYWHTLGVQQRKAGYYEDAIQTFKHAATIRNSKSIQKNISWLNKQLKLNSASVRDDDGAAAENGESAKKSTEDLRALLDAF